MSTLQVVHRPPPDADYRAPSGYRRAGIAIGTAGLGLATVSLIANVVAGQDLPADATRADELLAWSFGLNTAGFGTLKVGIAVILVGIVVRLWMRVESVKNALARLVPPDSAVDDPPIGPLRTPFGRAVVTERAPKPLLVHRVAKVMWAPMLAMGAMLVAAGLVLSFVQAGNVARNPALAADQGAWVQGLQFLGEGLLLAGISFLLGTILAGLREGGGEVQESLGLRVQTLRMPTTAKAFLGLMMLGVMLAVAQFIGYILLAGTVDRTSAAAAWSAWLGPTRELALGLLLSGVVLALATIGTVLGFQFSRIREIVRHGRLAER